MLRDWVGDWVGTFLGHKGAVWSAKLNGGDAARAVTGSADFSAKVWDTYTGECLHTFTHGHIVRSVAVDSDATNVITGGNEKNCVSLIYRSQARMQTTRSYFERALTTTQRTKDSFAVLFLGAARLRIFWSLHQRTSSFNGGT